VEIKLGKYSCSAGYEGPIYGVCSQGYFFYQNSCIPCSSNRVSIALIMVTVPVVILIVVYLCFKLWKLGGEEFKKWIAEAGLSEEENGDEVLLDKREK